MRLSFTYKSLLILPIIGGFLWNTNTPNSNGFSPIMGLGDTLTEAQKRLPENAVRNLTITEGVEAQLFASEPIMTNPTNIDVDERGRVWVCEAFNYRNAITGSPAKKEGDRILILEDTNGDGKADKNTVFYQGAEIESPLGIWVMGNQVIVSQSPYVWLFTDENGDDKADKKEILFQGMGGTQHDHGMHAFTFGPDGKFYFNFGNEGQTLKDKNNNVLRDKQGKDISLKNYRMGMVFRCNPDMTEIEVLGNNFRNNYEVAVDSYGAMWQSDNDDDGNKGVRINYVMDYGNYGYTDEMTGAGWQANRTNLETEIPQRHWHLNDPGVVPNLLQTGAGSPTGMCIYEGNLLPPIFRNQIIHCDAGPNVVRAYPVEKNGAGYTAKIVNIMEGTHDNWFRPSDVCVAPDGSLMVADWYDPGVGGHQAGDLNRGRIFRVSPPNTPYKIPTYDYSTTEGAIAALQNPNLSVRWHAWQVLHKMGEKANEPLLKLYLETTNSRVKARAFWLLAKSKNAKKSIEMAMNDNNPDIRIAAIRAARQGDWDISKVVKSLYDDPDPQVRRECMIAMRDSTWEETIQLLCHLALTYDGKDRWYLEALGIGAEGQWDALIEKIIYNDNKIKLSKQARADIIWRSRGEKSAMLLGELASDNSVPIKDRLRYFRAFDFVPSKNKSNVLLGIVKQNNAEVSAVALRHLDADFVKNNGEAKKVLRDLMATLKGKEYIEFAEKYPLKEEHERLLMMINKNEFSHQASDILFKNTEGVNFVKAIVENPAKEAEGINLLSAMRWTGGKKQLDMLNAAAFNTKRSVNFRTKAFEYLGGSWGGEDMVIQYLKDEKIDKEFIPAAVRGVSQAWRKQIRTEANKFLSNASETSTETANKMPKIEDLMALKSEGKQGLILFKDYCATCHQVKNEGVDFGPKLTNIGAKLSKEAQYAAILTPDAGISFGYEGWEIKTKDGSIYRGIITSTTAVELQLKSIGGSVQTIKIKDIKVKNKLSNSLMTAGFHEVLKPQELADLVGYLMSLK